MELNEKQMNNLAKLQELAEYNNWDKMNCRYCGNYDYHTIDCETPIVAIDSLTGEITIKRNGG